MAGRASPASLTISGLAAAAAVSIETVRYYQRRGLLQEPARPPGGVRRYANTDVNQLRFIKRAQAMGFTLEEIRSLLKLRAQDACHATRALAVSKLRLIDTNIRELQQLHKELARLVAACDANAGESHCPVIERLTH
ncbi:MAG TPA: MerR family transcriptional regulator [Steroidobacteraceae bacterium]|jgi:MerR family mercuric resistance operon transcriptional regulator|nr:MerR family transcriptional regulator [Steroidobacteraceae bacterium]